MLLVSALLLVLLIELSQAFKLTITSPTGNTVWRHKKEVWVHWKTEDGPPEHFGKIDVDLYVGPGDGVLIENISFGVPWTEKGAEWKVAKTLQPGSDYYILISTPQDKSFRVKSERFSVNGRGGLGKQNSATTQDNTGYAWTAMAILAAFAQFVFW